MTRKYFGTDGIRGTANTAPMTAEIALKVAQATALYFRNGDHRHSVVIGKDTRLSGYLLEPALTAGFVGMGMDVILSGPLPTPGVAMLTRSLRADLGVMISASHNPYQDNGIKLFGPDGYKLTDDVELEIEALMESDLESELSAPEKLGRAKRLDDAVGRYIEYVKNTFPRGQRLDDMKIVVDCANGAAYKAAPAVFWELGAEVITIGNKPNGFNINKDCGATATEAMSKAVVENGADIGIALDGDADRVIVCDETGKVIDGDQLTGLIAKSWLDQGTLCGDTVVATVMSNLGLEKYLEEQGLALKRMPVGDRYVVDHMRANGFNVGGEQAGHIVLGDYGTTGDGLVAALQVLSVVEASDKPASEICDIFTPCPQLLRNIRYEGEVSLESEEIQRVLTVAEDKLRDQGRILVRKSGTEPLIRVMVEGEDESLIKSVAAELCDAIETVAGKAA